MIRKVDLRIIPWLSFLYLLSFLDRTNIGNARLAGLEADLGMKGHDYNIALSVFFVSLPSTMPKLNMSTRLILSIGELCYSGSHDKCLSKTIDPTSVLYDRDDSLG